MGIEHLTEYISTFEQEPKKHPFKEKLQELTLSNTDNIAELLNKIMTAAHNGEMSTILVVGEDEKKRLGKLSVYLNERGIYNHLRCGGKILYVNWFK